MSSDVNSFYTIQTRINGKAYRLDISPTMTLLEILQNEVGLMKTKRNCENTLILNSRVVNACQVLGVESDKADILTAEGLEANSPPSETTKQTIQTRINGKAYRLDISPTMTLLEMLQNEAGLMKTKRNCEAGYCGSCTLLLNGKPVNACQVLGVEADRTDIVTFEEFRGRPTNFFTLPSSISWHMG